MDLGATDPARRITKAPPIRRGLSRFRPHCQTADVSIRYSVQAETREECVQGLELFVRMGLVPVLLPVQVMDDRWMARAVPPPVVKTPAEGDRDPAP